MFLDIELPSISGLETIPKPLRLNSELDIIMLTIFEEEKMIFRATCLVGVSYFFRLLPNTSKLYAIVKIDFTRTLSTILSSTKSLFLKS